MTRRKRKRMKISLENKKALSPVVAAIILIGVTVAVSIAVAAWMGSLTIGYMETKEFSIVDVDFTLGDVSTGKMVLKVNNFGTSDVTIHRIRVNGETASTWSTGNSETVYAGSEETFTITHEVTETKKYAITMYTIDGTMVGSFTATA